MLHEMRLPFETNSDGGAIVYGERGVLGRLIAVMYDRGDMATGANFSLTTDNYDVVEVLWSEASAGTSDVIFYPRRLTQAAVNGADLSGAGELREAPLMIGRPKLTITSGGDIKSGAIILIYEE